jgi:hypothetical protein
VVISPQIEQHVVSRSVGQARIYPDGRFSFSDVPPGQYVIRARGETECEGSPLFATFRVTVQERDLSGLELIMSPGATIEGRVEALSRHGSPLPSLAALRVRAQLAEGAAIGETMSGPVRADGTFRLSGLMPGTHVLMFEHLLFPWRIGEARLRGRDIAERAFDIEGSEGFRDVRVVLTDTAAGVSGVVAVPPRVAADDLLVIAFPADALLRRVPLRFVRVGRVAPDGGYRVLDLPPGDYLVVAVTQATEADAMVGALLDRLAPKATAVRLSPAQFARVTLDAVVPGRETIP